MSHCVNSQGICPHLSAVGKDGVRHVGCGLCSSPLRNELASLLVLMSVVGGPVLGFGASQAARHSLERHLYRADFTSPTQLALGFALLESGSLPQTQCSVLGLLVY